MATTPITAETRAARAWIARALTDAILPPTTLGSITLRPHQRAVAALITHRLRRWQGALLLDPVGSGKTYTALAVAQSYARLVVTCPAAVIPAWRRALRAIGREAALVSFEALSRGTRASSQAADLLIVDEAHQVRNPRTRRYAALAHLAWGRHVLCLTATPVHNTSRDAAALVRLFHDVDDDDLPATVAAVACRASRGSLAIRPAIEPPRWIANPAPAEVLDLLLRLPAPVPADDAGVARALGVLGLVRHWASSRPALQRAIARRLTQARALEALVAAGESPTRHNVHRTVADDDLLQLPLGLDTASPSRPAAWEHALSHWIAALLGVRDLVMHRADWEEQRLSRLIRVLREERAGPAVLFTHSVATAQATWRALHHQVRCAGLWGATTRVSSGTVPREEILARLRPGAGHDSNDSLRVDVLVATDVVSEGIDLHAAGLVIHLDLPWTPARLEQRTGRLARFGSPHRSVRQVAFRPPDAPTSGLRLLDRLRRKARVSRALVGIDPSVLWPEAAPRPARSRLHPIEGLASLADRWRSVTEARDQPAIAAIVAPGARTGFVAAIDTAQGPRLIGCNGGDVTEDLTTLAPLLELADGPPATDVPPTSLRRALSHVKDHLAAREVLAGAAHASPTHREVLKVLDEQLMAASRTARARLALRLRDVRDLVIRARGAGAQRWLAEWLIRRKAMHGEDALAELEATLKSRSHEPVTPRPERLIALLLVIPKPANVRA